MKVVAGAFGLVVLAALGFTIWFDRTLGDHPLFSGRPSFSARIVETVIAGQRFCIPRNHFFDNPQPRMEAAILAFWLPDYSGWRKGRDPHESAKNHFSAVIHKLPPNPDGVKELVRDRLIEEIDAPDHKIYIRKIISPFPENPPLSYNISFDHLFLYKNGRVKYYYSCEPYAEGYINHGCNYKKFVNNVMIRGSFDVRYEYMAQEISSKIDHFLWSEWQCDRPHATPVMKEKPDAKR